MACTKWSYRLANSAGRTSTGMLQAAPSIPGLGIFECQVPLAGEVRIGFVAQIGHIETMGGGEKGERQFLGANG